MPMRKPHVIDYVKVRTTTGTLSRNLPAVEGALRAREADGYRLVSSVPDTQNGDLVGVLLVFVAT
ncbi:MAG TPA: hypothetical protein VK279_00770 [Solirubrobacteraceae bacterium]|nr:hypothetical protein [Solirubrobacteraceae bacterium]